MNFSASPQINTDVTLDTVRFGLIAAGISLIFMIIPTIGASSSYDCGRYHKQDRSRALRSPWWQRVWLDFLLLIPAAYGMYKMKYQGGLVIPGQDTSQAMDPFQNPLLLFVATPGYFCIDFAYVAHPALVNAGDHGMG